jgi:peptidylprolyl isomerase/peptidyl-prolyl cis-trans isomerase B (cyclophilin B)
VSQGRRAEVAKQREVAARRQRLWLVGVAVCVLVAGGAIVRAASEADEPSPTIANPSGTGDPIAPVGPGVTFPTGPPVDLEPAEPGATLDGATPCPAKDGSSPRTTTFAEPPPDCLEDGVRYTAVIETSKGPLRVLLHDETAREAVNNFVVLARYHYYEGAPFTIVAPRGILQAGDPNGEPPGTGGPGYLLPSGIDPEFPPIYPTLTVAAVAEGPDYTSIGSQFFIAAGDDATALDPVHPPIGLLTDGMDALRAIEAIGNVSTARPTEDVRIVRVTIEES